MKSMGLEQAPKATLEARAHALFQEQDRALKTRTDRMFIGLMSVQWVFAILIALWVSPLTWRGRTSSVHSHLLAAVLLGGAINLFPFVMVRLRPGALETRLVIASAQACWSAFLIHLSGGRIESHFHIFGSLAFLAAYRDWRVLLPATIVTAFDHVARQLFWPESVYGIAAPEAWRFLEHAGWVVFEDVFLVMTCVSSMREARLHAHARVAYTDRLEREMAVGARVQTCLLPPSPRATHLEVSATMIPATEVGGDYYDVVRVPDGAWIGIGDVAGHGLQSGLVMLQAQSAIRALVQRDPNASPSSLLCDVNAVLYENIRERMKVDEHMTLSLLRYFDDGRVVAAGAHEDLVIFRQATKKCELVEVRGTWVGARRDIRAATKDLELRLEPGDMMVLYTDGVTEARSRTREMFGLDRLCEAVETDFARGADGLRDHLLGLVKGWTERQDDDVTLVVLQHTGPRAATSDLAAE